MAEEDKKITIMYDNNKHNYNQVIRRVIEPLLAETGVYEDFEEHHEHRIITSDIYAFEVETEFTETRDIRRFANRHSINLEKLTADAYFLRSLRK